MPNPLDDLLAALESECPLCHREPTDATVRGPVASVLAPCGHVVDAREWLDEPAGGERRSTRR